MIVSGRRIAIALRTEGNQRKSQRNSKRSVLLSCGRFDTCRRSTLSCWRRIRISATSFVLGLKNEAMIWRISRSNPIIKWQGYRVSASRLAESNFRYTQVGSILDPARHSCIGGPAARRIVLEAAIFGRIVRRRNDDPIRKACGSLEVKGEDCMRDCRRRRTAVIEIDHGLYAIRREHLERFILSPESAARRMRQPLFGRTRSRGKLRNPYP